ncbi:MAG: flagellar hook protein FlgE [Filomicrobium sp.]
MSVYGLMRTGASGMAAQGNRLGAVADNIANVNTAGYKAASTEFSTLVLGNNETEYSSGGVETAVRYRISEQGNLQFTQSSTDLGIEGGGFFLVQTSADATGLTRAGSFVPNGEGELVNAAGFKLLGYPVQAGGNTVVANGTAGLEPVSIATQSLVASPSTLGSLTVNLPSSEAIVPAGSLPSDNVVGSQYTSKSSLVGFDYLGNEVVVDVYFTKTAAETWEVSVYDNSLADPATTFPYSAGPLVSQTLTFDATSGALTSASTATFTFPGGSSFDLDLAGSTQLAAGYTVLDVNVNGNGPSEVETLEFTDDGYVYAVYENSSRAAIYQVPLATVISPDQLNPSSGNVYTLSADSGELRVGFPGESGMGKIVSGALEGSTVDLATELTMMIESQRNYTANSKVFQTGSDLLDVLVNLKR